MPARSLRILPIAAIVATLGAAAGFWLWRPTAPALVAQARQAAAAGDDRRALELASRALQQDAGSVEALVIAALAARRAGEVLRAGEYLRRLPDELPTAHPDLVPALKEAGQSAIRSGRATEAERFYRQALSLAPDDQLIHRRLSGLYLGQARRWESAPHLFALVRAQAFTLEELAFLGNLEELYDAEPLMRFFEESLSDDVAPLMGRARLLLFKNSPREGEELLRQIVAARPDLIEAQAQLGVVLVSESRDAEFRLWHRTLPLGADQHPEIWWVRATQSRKEGNTPAAIRCAWEALRLDPNHVGATYQLAQFLAAEGQVEQSQAFARRAAQLDVLNAAIHEVLLRQPTGERLLRCARACEDLGRLWEAWGWHVAVDTYAPEQAVAGERARLRALLTPDTPQTLPAHCLARTFDLSHYPLPIWDRAPDASPPHRDAPKLAEKSTIRFEDIALTAGLDFHYENGADPHTPGLMIYQSIGGGVAVIDYDSDGAPDLFFPQAGAWPPVAPYATDRLYRNAAGSCRDVTAAALPVDADFGFGAAAGDFDVDGFPDIYVANAGRNRLLRNNGDGTFSDVTQGARLVRDGVGSIGPPSRLGEWTVSCLIADLNADGLPDLYDVNYCAGARPIEHMCHRSDGVAIRTCIPTEFPPADDWLLVNLGDGRFEECGASAGILAPEGRGLGIVAAHLDDEPGLDIFIANDMSANFLFSNCTPAGAAHPQFVERGVVSGTAYDSDGRSQACMGVAADDGDGDGLLDLFVTNFYNESNTCYRRQPGGFFVDATRQMGLRAPSMEMLGWGTQFLDADLDGRPDLVVVNGHVDDFSEQDIPYRMRPQFFHNQGQAFVEVAADSLGAFFVEEQLGRGLARLDWDNDGREDFVVSRMFLPAALVVNRTPTAGRSVAVRLIGRADRDAVGAEVRVTATGRTLVKQLTAGDGFAASNQRQLVFGLGSAAAIDEVRVRWPGGQIQVYRNLLPGERWLLVEGSTQALRGRREQP